MEQVSKKGPAYQAYMLLKMIFIFMPIAAGLDKFFYIAADWAQYLHPIADMHAEGIMMVVGVVEVVVGIGVIFKPHVFAYIVGVWLVFIILNLIFMGDFYDIALRDLGLCFSAFALARLAKVYQRMVS